MPAGLKRIVFALTLCSVGLGLVPGAAPAAGRETGGRFIVSFRKGVDPARAERRVQARLREAGSQSGAAGPKKRLGRGSRRAVVVENLSPAQAAELAALPDVVSVVPDLLASAAALPERRVAGPWRGGAGAALGARGARGAAMVGAASASLVDDPAQAFPVGVARIKSRLRPRGTGHETPPPRVGVAVIDTGVDPGHPDINVVQSVSFVDVEPEADDAKTVVPCRDRPGHVRAVPVLVVGVIPGAPVYALKVLDADGAGYYSDIIQALDWVEANADKIAVVNMSLGGPPYENDGDVCGVTRENWLGVEVDVVYDPVHEAICRVVNMGVVVVVAAGNDAVDAGASIPAKYDEALTVSAIVDTDGEPGALGPSYGGMPDDSFAGFSNFGAVVDIAAPGVGILSTYPLAFGAYAYLSGTSMASPHVAGAVALHIARHGRPEGAVGVATLKTTLRAVAMPGGGAAGYVGDPDGAKDPLVSIDHLPFRK